jgi:D-glycero-D-manno-heptose 1,7-bisphosphate phosphatase
MRPSAPRAPLAAIFLDRDGTLIEHVPYLRDPADVALLPGVREALARARDAAVKLFLFTNQSGVGRGMFTLGEVEACNERMIELLGLGPRPFDAVCIATETPDEPPRYRKPSPRFIREMIERHGIDPRAAWMLGDSPVDWEAGLNAGIRTAAIVADPLAPKEPQRRQELGIAAFETVLDWLDAVWERPARG